MSYSNYYNNGRAATGGLLNTSPSPSIYGGSYNSITSGNQVSPVSSQQTPYFPPIGGNTAGGYTASPSLPAAPSPGGYQPQPPTPIPYGRVTPELRGQASPAQHNPWAWNPYRHSDQPGDPANGPGSYFGGSSPLVPPQWKMHQDRINPRYPSQYNRYPVQLLSPMAQRPPTYTTPYA